MKGRLRCFPSFFECHVMWIVLTLSDGMNHPRLGIVSSKAPDSNSMVHSLLPLQLTLHRE